MNPWLIVCASPRVGGNSDDASVLLDTALRQGGALVERVDVREYAIAPCVACNLCRSAPDSCSLDEPFTGRTDHAAELLARMREAAGLVFVTPVYFYSLPALFKALIDRSQRYWWSNKEEPVAGAKPAYALLIGARTSGERLFDGSLLTLRHFSPMIGYQLMGSLPLRGLDQPGSLVATPEMVECVGEWASTFLQVSG